MPRARIQDEFATVNVSRQMRYQMRHKALGLCISCSREHAPESIFCDKHSKSRKRKQKAAYRAAKKASKQS